MKNLIKLAMCSVIMGVVFAQDDYIAVVFSETTLADKKFCAVTEATRVVSQLDSFPSIVFPEKFDRDALIGKGYVRPYFDYKAYTDLVAHYFMKQIGGSIEGVKKERHIKKNLRGLLKNFFELNVLHENDIIRIAEEYNIHLTYRFYSRLCCKKSRQDLVYAGIMESVKVKE